MKKGIKNTKKSGFLKLIIVIVIALLLLNYFHISMLQVADWFVKLFHSVFK